MRNPNRETTFRFRQFSVENRRSAMKVGTDGVLLGAWAEFPPSSPAAACLGILDIGAGTGLVSLMLAQRFPSAAITAIEIDPESARECLENFRHSPWSARLSLLHGNFIEEPLTGGYGLIVSNPPFFNNGAKAPDHARHTARHEDSLPLEKLIGKSAALLAPGRGSLALVLPAERGEEAEFAAEVARLRLWRKVSLSTVPGKPPRRVLMQFVNNGMTETASGLLADADLPEISAECLSATSGQRSPWHRNLVKDFYLNP